MRASLTSLGRRLPDLAAELAAIADGLDRNGARDSDVATIERARRVADRVLRGLAEETGVPSAESVTNLIDALLEKHAMPHTIAAHLRVLYDANATLVGDAARALIAFLEWRVGSRSRMSAMPARRSKKLPLVLGVAIAVVGIAIAVVLARRGEPVEPTITSGPMARIPGATFEMGSSDAELAAALDHCRDVDHRAAWCVGETEFYVQEQRRTVTVSAFEIDRHEVTVGEFVSWLATHPQHDRAFPNVRLDPETKRCTAAPGREQLPIAGVTWDDARRYCEAVGKRLPTEAEWELAARGTQRRKYPWGSEPPQCTGVIFARELDRACSLGSPGDAAPVGTAAQDVTPEGVFDLGGNVSEWTADGGGERPRCDGPCVDPQVPEGVTRVVRGGHWGAFSGQLRAAARSAIDPKTARTNLGFRCAR